MQSWDLDSSPDAPIVRTWRGATRAADAPAYAELVRATGLRDYAATPGHLGAFLFQRQLGELAEIVVLSVWDSVDAIRAFAGDDIGRARFYPEDDAFLVERDLHCDHYRLTAGLPLSTAAPGSVLRATDQSSPEPTA